MTKAGGAAVLTVVVAIAATIAPTGEVWCGDRHAGYYYPPPSEVEVYTARARVLPDADSRRRVAFVTAIAQQDLQRPYPPVAALFAKGEEKEKLIIVANELGRLNTIYRARAFLASLTSSARTTPIFQEYGLEEVLTFFDLARMLGFELITISDGEAFTHQIRLE